jgi:hypothetical protein
VIPNDLRKYEKSALKTQLTTLPSGVGFASVLAGLAGLFAKYQERMIEMIEIVQRNRPELKPSEAG